MKDKLKAMFTRNIGMKLVSVAIAFFVWIAIINFSNPKVTKTISGIPIAQRNTDLVNTENKTYVTDSAKTVTIRIYGSRSDIQNITEEDFEAYIDFREMSSVYAVPVHVDLKKDKNQSDIEITKQSLTMVTGKIEESLEDRRDVKVQISGVPEDYFAKCTYQSSYTLNVTGSTKAISSIANLVANVDLKESTESVNALDVTLTAVDRNGKEVDLTDVKLSQPTIEVNILVLPVESKNVVLVPELTTIAGRVVNYDKIDWTRTVPLAAEREVLDSIDQIVVTYKKTDLYEDVVESSFSIGRFLPDNVYVAAATDTISILIPVEKEGDKPFEVRTATITVRNLAETLKYTFANDTVSFSARDLSDILQEITESDLNLYVDLSEVTEPGLVEIQLRSQLPNVDDDLREDGVTVPIQVELIPDETENGQGGDNGQGDDNGQGGDNQPGGDNGET